MGTMSASDAAPLPRLGEVFFDVRGDSRSMRLSWYADTGVAVLSIWQGGMCTGTFRLAIADLPRMVETLQRGPGGQRPERGAGLPGQAPAGDQPRTLGHVHAMPPPPGDHRSSGGYPPGGPRHRSSAPDYPAEPAGYPPSPAGYPAEPAGYPAEPASYPAEPAGYGQPDYQTGSYQPEQRAWNPGDGGAYPHGLDGAGYPERPYAPGPAAADYRGEPAPHYVPGTTASSDGDALRVTADYPAHYAGAVTDDDQPAPPEDSHPYGRPPSGRRAASRHAAPGGPFD
jgi:hypothetical protein